MTKINQVIGYDRALVWAACGLLALGLIEVTSASMVISERQFGNSFHYIFRQLIYLGMGLAVGFVIVRIEIAQWKKFGIVLLLLSIVLLVMVLIPGIGRAVNGSRRWISLGLIGVQVSELAKLCVIIYMSSYLVRHQEEVQNQMSGFIKPMLVLAIIGLLLLKEPDFGAAAVIMATALGMMFLAGVRLWQFAILLTVVVVVLAVIAISSPYRMMRLTTFLNPWARQFDSGYQLTQSLIAFGRGGWFGVGLGDSIQKLFYLPEAHTDFLFAVLAEELGLVGVLTVIGLFSILISRILVIARQAQLHDRLFAAYMAYGFAFWIGLQAMINIGVNAGLLPTKGLTLPLMSYGGSSMIVMSMVMSLLLRIDYENRQLGLSQAPERRRRRRYYS